MEGLKYYFDYTMYVKKCELHSKGKITMAMTYYHPRRRMIRTHLRTAAVDVIETDESYIVRANIPGFEKDEIEIDADFESLKFTAVKAEDDEAVEEKVENEEEKVEEPAVRYLHRERHFGKVSRTMTFAKPIDASKASVTLVNGVLEITLPFSEEARSIKLVPN